MKATKKLILASVSLLAASTLTVGSTFAWFSYQSNVELGSVEFYVDSGDENLQVAVVAHGESDSATLTDSDFKYFLDGNAVSDAIKKNNDGNKIVYKPLTVAKDSGSQIAEKNAIDLKDENGDSASVSSYAVFDLVFRYTPAKSGDEPYLLLDFGSEITADDDYAPANKVVATETLANGDYGDKKLTQGEEFVARARDAARVAFLYESKGDTYNRVWAPSEDYGIDPSDTSDTKKGFYKGNLAADYRGVSVVTPVYSGRIYAAPQTISENKEFWQIKRFPEVEGGKTYSELTITVKVWLEGDDGDCLETVLGDAFAFTLKFRTSTIKNAS